MEESFFGIVFCNPSASLRVLECVEIKMRIIGYLKGETAARLFVDYLYVKGVECKPERESGEQFAIWVHAEDQLEYSGRLFEEFNANPRDPKYALEGEKAAALRQAASKEEARYQKRVKGRAETLNTLNRGGMGKLTLSLIVLCSGIFILMSLNDLLWVNFFRWLSISNFRAGGGSVGLPEVFHGQIWRLVTPILMHGSFLHILFNLWWLKDLGGILEWRLGWKPVLFLILVIAIGSNLAQYYTSGPRFLGISGVVFGLLGFIWMKGKYDPDFGLQLPQVVVFMMLLWLVLGYTGVLDRSVGKIANTAHSAGLVMGMLCAFLPFWGGKR